MVVVVVAMGMMAMMLCLPVIAIVVYALEEYVTQTPVVKETPFLFQPVWTLGGLSG